MPSTQTRFPGQERCEHCNAALAYQDRQVVCSACRAPVLPGHPLQVEFDAQWSERDARDQQEARRLAVPAAVPGLVYSQAAASALEAVTRLEARVNALESEVAILKAQGQGGQKRKSG